MATLSTPNLSHTITHHPHLHLHRTGSSSPVRNSTERRPHTSSADIELQHRPVYTRETDPYSLSHGLKSPENLSQLCTQTNRIHNDFDRTFRKYNKRRVKARDLRKHYKHQNETIERLLKPVDDHIRSEKEYEGENQLKYQIAVQGSLAANICLAVLQVAGALSSGGSLSLFTTAADAVFDPLSNLSLIWAHHAMKKVDGRQYPSGKARIETRANIVFCFLMIVAAFILIAFSIKELSEGASAEGSSQLRVLSVAAVGIAFVTKLVLFLYCCSLRKKYSQIQILWVDHRNDLFINGVGLITSVGGRTWAWWIDPAGAILLSCLILYLWGNVSFEEFELLIGVTAGTEIQQWITYISMTHSPMIKAIDTVRAYHSGPRFIVEVDVVIDPEETLREAHDVAEALQMKLESLPNVERAYVHIDYETSHKPEHFLLKL